jgi:hypothetical protein
MAITARALGTLLWLVLTGVAAAADPLLTGTVIGSTGTSGNGGANAFDGNTGNRFEGASADGMWVGLDLGSGNAKVISRIRLYPAGGGDGATLWRMGNARLEGSNQADFSAPTALLYFNRGFYANWADLTVTDPGAYRYLRYLSPLGGYGTVAEVEFYGAASAGGTVATPTFSPTAGTYASNQAITIACATAGARIYYTVDGTDPTEDSPLYAAAVPLRANTTLKAQAYIAGKTTSAVAQGAYTVAGTSAATIHLGTTSHTGYTSTSKRYEVAQAIASGRWDFAVAHESVIATGTTLELTTTSIATGFAAAIPAVSGHGAGNSTLVSWAPRIDLTALGVRDYTTACQTNSAGGDIVATATLDFAAGEVGTVHLSWGGFTNNSKGGAILSVTDATSAQTFTSATYPAMAFTLNYNDATGPRQLESIFSVTGCRSLVCAVRDNNDWNNYGKAFISGLWIEGQVAPPTVSIPAGTYVGTQTVSLACASSSAQIRYTLDGSTPTAASTLYASPLSVAATTTINARAFKSGWTTSPTTIATYTITAPVLSIVWCQDDAGTGATASAQTWALGSGVTLGRIYDTDPTTNPTNTAADYAVGGTAGSPSAPSLSHLRNIGNITVDLLGKVVNPAHWSAGTSAGENTYVLKAKVGGGGYVTLGTSDTEVLGGLTVAANGEPYYLQLTMPTSVTAGSGVEQEVQIAFTATPE